MLGRRDVLTALGTAMKQLQKCAEPDDGMLATEQAALVSVVPLLQARLLHVLHVRLLTSMADGNLPATQWYDAPSKSVKLAYQALTWGEEPQDQDAIILATTPKTMTAWGVPPSLREHAANTLHSLLDYVPEREKRVFLHERAPGGRDDTKLSWYVLTAAGKTALIGAAHVQLAAMASSAQEPRDAPSVGADGCSEDAAEDTMEGEASDCGGEAPDDTERAAEAAMEMEQSDRDDEAPGEVEGASEIAKDKASGVEDAAAPSNVTAPSSLAELLQALADRNNLADAGSMAFGRVKEPGRELRTPFIKAYTAAGGIVELDKTEPLPQGFHVLQVRAPPTQLQSR